MIYYSKQLNYIELETVKNKQIVYMHRIDGVIS